MGALRVFLALSVVVFHIPNQGVWLVNGAAAVLLFFIISGFYMAFVLNEKYSDNSEFYVSRLARLFPSYFVMLFIMIGWSAYLDSPNVMTSSVGLPLAEQALLIAMNTAIVGQDVYQMFVDSVTVNEDNFFVKNVGTVFTRDFFNANWILIGQAWSLSSEIFFYMCAPFIVRSVRRVVIMLIASLALRVVVIYGFGYSSAIWGGRFFPITLCFFLLGSLAYHIGRLWGDRLPMKQLGLFFIILFSSYSLFSIVAYGGIFLTGNYDAVGPWASYIIFAAAIPCIFECTKKIRFDREIGEISYLLYIVHGLVIGIVYAYDDAAAGDAGKFISAIAGTFALAIAIHFVIERPVSRYAQSANRAAFRRYAVAFASALVLVEGAHLVAVASAPQSEVRHQPTFVASHGRYNVVKHGDQYIGAPHGLDINWMKDNIRDIPGVIIEKTAEAVTQRINSQAEYFAKPEFIESMNEYNLVAFKSEYFGIPHGLAADLARDNVRGLPGVIVGNEIQNVRDQIRQKKKFYSEPRFIESLDGYNIVAFKSNYFGLPHGLAVDLDKDDARGLPGVFINDELQDLRDQIKSQKTFYANPLLVETIKNYNIVAFRHHYFGVPHGLNVDFFANNVGSIDGVITGDTADDVRRRMP